jgi:TnpA family transposase
VSVAEREAIHTLEALLHTPLPIAEHTTDTHGATELVFALFDLLGLSFIPRLRDAGDLRLYLLGDPSACPSTSSCDRGPGRNGSLSGTTTCCGRLRHSSAPGSRPAC